MQVTYRNRHVLWKRRYAHITRTHINMQPARHMNQTYEFWLKAKINIET